MDIHPFDLHMKELKEFSELVSLATDVQFHNLSFNELLNQWALNSVSEVQQLVGAMRHKYSVIIAEKQ